MINRQKIGSLYVADLVKKYGSPLYIYDERVIRDQFKALTRAITYRPLRINYAAKANTNPEILKILREEGSYLDVVSPGEIIAALQAGFSPSEMLFTGTSVSDSELLFMKEKGVMVNLDSLSAIARFGKINPGAKISVRINPDVGAGHHSHNITGGPDSKFGIYFDQLNEIKKIAKESNLIIIGLHQHIGSGILETDKFMLAMDVMIKVAKEFEGLEFIDFGGGIGIPYKPEQEEIDIKSLGKQISQKFDKFCKEYGKKLTLYLEPGRFLVAQSGILACTVNTVKKTPAHVFVGVDSGFNHLIRPMAYGSYHKIVKADEVESKKLLGQVIAGNICESGDCFTIGEHAPLDRMLPEIKEGDIIAILDAGAYGYSMAMPYNMRPRPIEILVNGTKSRVIRNADTYEDLLRGVVGA